ncbi:hypothetical protein L1987_86810 [Smallanthus sonchifolius]|uniref:Uncharacterized protein n=1 Tax=Smallanthus sonchifolius TaxID=185202 RepID=A0ACB8Y126_9ASTR|nr:hypothetical protein L1987_86810 [Smallanthus sonchifolius]
MEAIIRELQKALNFQINKGHLHISLKAIKLGTQNFTNWVANRLKKALEFQEDYEIWGPKLPIDYEEIIRVSNTPEIYKKKLKKDLYNMFSKGILLQDGKVWFWLGRNGERNEMISAKRFSYKNHLLRKWRSIPESRFPKAEHEEIQKLKDIQQVLKSKSKADKFRFSPSNMKVKKDHMTWYSLSRIKRKKDEMLSATNVVYNSSSVAILSRFSGAIEFLPRQPKRDFIDDEKDLHFKMMIINNIIMMNLIPKSTKASTIGHEVTRYARMLESCGVKATYARKDEDVEVQKLHMPERYARIPESCGVKATYARKDEDVKGLGIDDEQGVWFAFVLVEPALTDMENL